MLSLEIQPRGSKYPGSVFLRELLGKPSVPLKGVLYRGIYTDDSKTLDYAGSFKGAKAGLGLTSE